MSDLAAAAIIHTFFESLTRMRTSDLNSRDRETFDQSDSRITEESFVSLELTHME